MAETAIEAMYRIGKTMLTHRVSNADLGGTREVMPAPKARATLERALSCRLTSLIRSPHGGPHRSDRLASRPDAFRPIDPLAGDARLARRSALGVGGGAGQGGDRGLGSPAPRARGRGRAMGRRCALPRGLRLEGSGGAAGA